MSRLYKLVPCERTECTLLYSNKIQLDRLIQYNCVDLVDKDDNRSTYLLLHSFTSRDKIADTFDVDMYGYAFDLYVDNKCKAQSEIFTDYDEAISNLIKKTPKKYKKLYEFK